MSWKLTGHPKTQRVTQELAKKFSEMDPAPQDRPLSENRLKVYEKLIHDGAFRPCSWAAAYCKETGGTYRVNGKHTSTIMSGINLKEVQDLYAVVEYYECDELSDVTRLYATYDSRIQSRTVADINQSFAGCVKELVDNNIPAKTINVCVGGIWFADLQEAYHAVQAQERAECLLTYPDFVVWSHKLLGRGQKHKHMQKTPVIAAMFLTYRKAPRIAQQFWEAVRDETGASPTDPDRKLSRFLIMNSVRQDPKRPNRFKPRDREFFVKCLHAWNAFRKEEGTNLNYYATATIPEVV